MRTAPAPRLRFAKITFIACFLGSSALAESPGLTVRADGTLLRAGEPYRGIGINCFDLFLKRIKNPSDKSHEQRLTDLARLGVPFVRFNAGGFWPVDWQLYRDHPEDYFGLLDEVVAAAEKHHVGLIPSLFWHVPTVPDLVGEPINAWGKTDSATHRFMSRYVEQLVRRYARSPAIWAWEMGNEYNLLVAIRPDGGAGQVVPKLGTPESRGPKDKLDQGDLQTAMEAFARDVRRHDPYRAIITGNSIPRWAAEHLNRTGQWTADSRGEFVSNLIASNPDGVNTISVHVYPHALEKRFGQDQVSYAALFEAITDASARCKKPVFVGEFGADLNELGPALSKQHILDQLAAIEKASVALAAVWVYDFPPQEGTHSIRPDNDLAWILNVLRETNARLQSSGQR